MPRVRLLAVYFAIADCLDNGLALTPPLGWRSYNAFGGHVDQSMMVAMMRAMVEKRRSSQCDSRFSSGAIQTGTDLHIVPHLTPLVAKPFVSRGRTFGVCDER